MSFFRFVQELPGILLGDIRDGNPEGYVFIALVAAAILLAIRALYERVRRH